MAAMKVEENNKKPPITNPCSGRTKERPYISDTHLVKRVQVRNAVVGILGGIILIPIALALSIPFFLCDLTTLLCRSSNKKQNLLLNRLQFSLILAMFARAKVRKNSLQHTESHIINTPEDLPKKFQNATFDTLMTFVREEFYQTDFQEPYFSKFGSIPINTELALELGFIKEEDLEIGVDQKQVQVNLLPIYFHGFHDTPSAVNSMLISADHAPNIISQCEKTLLNKLIPKMNKRKQKNEVCIPILVGHSQGGAIANLLATKHNLPSITFNAQPVSDKLGEKFTGKEAWNATKTDPAQRGKHINFVEQGDWVSDMKTSWFSAPQLIGETYILPESETPGNHHLEIIENFYRFLYTKRPK